MRDRIDASQYGTTEVYSRNHPGDPWIFQYSYSGYKKIDRCRDEDSGRLIVDHYQILSSLTDVIRPDGAGGEFRYVNWVPNYSSWYPQQGPLVSSGAPNFWFGTPSQRATRLAAMTNVSTPVVDVGQFLGELKDLPSSILKRGREGISWAKSESLGVRFGIMPMVSDILKMADVQEYTFRKTSQLQNLLYSKGSRRKVKMGQANATWTVDLSSVFGSGAHAACQTNVTRWGTIWWKPGGALMTFDANDPDKTKLIRGLLTGTSKYNDKVSYLADAWELLPWSWLADWCGNLGEYLRATQNQNISTVDSIWLMEQIVDDQLVVTPSGSASLHQVSKYRYPGNITASTTAPFISGDRAAILSGLFIRSPSPIPKRYRS